MAKFNDSIKANKVKPTKIRRPLSVMLKLALPYINLLLTISIIYYLYKSQN